MDEATIQLVKVAASVAGATATVITTAITVVAKPVWSKLKSIEETTGGIKAKVAEQNGRIGKMEMWQGMHEGHDDERHQAMIAGRAEVVSKVAALRTELSTAVSDLHTAIRDNKVA